MATSAPLQRARNSAIVALCRTGGPMKRKPRPNYHIMRTCQ